MQKFYNHEESYLILCGSSICRCNELVSTLVKTKDAAASRPLQQQLLHLKLKNQLKLHRLPLQLQLPMHRLFLTKEVNKSLAEYKKLISDYSAAVASKDNAKIKEFTAKYQTWAQNASTLAAKLRKPERSSEVR